MRVVSAQATGHDRVDGSRVLAFNIIEGKIPSFAAFFTQADIEVSYVNDVKHRLTTSLLKRTFLNGIKDIRN